MDPRILNLLFAVMSYVGSKPTTRNPLVKGLGEEDNAAIYENMVQALMDCEEFFPEVNEMVESYLNEQEMLDADKEIEDYWNGQ